MFLESFNLKTFPKHLLFGFHGQMHFLIFASKPELHYQFELKKE